MRGSLMLGMVPGMLDRLSLSQSTDRNDTEYEEDREELESSTIHRQQPSMIQSNATGYPQDLSSCLLAPERLLIIRSHLIGFMEKMLYTASNVF